MFHCTTHTPIFSFPIKEELPYNLMNEICDHCTAQEVSKLFDFLRYLKQKPNENYFEKLILTSQPVYLSCLSFMKKIHKRLYSSHQFTECGKLALFFTSILPLHEPTSLNISGDLNNSNPQLQYDSFALSTSADAQFVFQKEDLIKIQKIFRNYGTFSDTWKEDSTTALDMIELSEKMVQFLEKNISNSNTLVEYNFELESFSPYFIMENSLLNEKLDSDFKFHIQLLTEFYLFYTIPSTQPISLPPLYQDVIFKLKQKIETALSKWDDYFTVLKTVTTRELNHYIPWKRKEKCKPNIERATPFVFSQLPSFSQMEHLKQIPIFEQWDSLHVFPLPSLDSYAERVQHESNPESGIEEEYRIIHNKIFQWRSARLLGLSDVEKLSSFVTSNSNQSDEQLLVNGLLKTSGGASLLKQQLMQNKKKTNQQNASSVLNNGEDSLETNSKSNTTTAATVTTSNEGNHSDSTAPATAQEEEEEEEEEKYETKHKMTPMEMEDSENDNNTMEDQSMKMDSMPMEESIASEEGKSVVEDTEALLPPPLPAVEEEANIEQKVDDEQVEQQESNEETTVITSLHSSEKEIEKEQQTIQEETSLKEEVTPVNEIVETKIVQVVVVKTDDILSVTEQTSETTQVQNEESVDTKVEEAKTTVEKEEEAIPPVKKVETTVSQNRNSTGGNRNNQTPIADSKPSPQRQIKQEDQEQQEYRRSDRQDRRRSNDKYGNQREEGRYQREDNNKYSNTNNREEYNNSNYYGAESYKESDRRNSGGDRSSRLKVETNNYNDRYREENYNSRGNSTTTPTSARSNVNERDAFKSSNSSSSNSSRNDRNNDVLPQQQYYHHHHHHPAPPPPMYYAPPPHKRGRDESDYASSGAGNSSGGDNNKRRKFTRR